jgi:acyl carrier protein
VPAIRNDRHYLVTGGLEGFGLQAALWLVEQGARHLALVSRRGDAAEGAPAALDRFRVLGVEAVAYACDVADEAALTRVLETMRRSGPPLGGVIHAAVVMDDGLLPSIDEGRFARALHPKFEGTALLDRLTREDPIGLFIVFSSVTTVLGNPGQANYVAANAAAEAVITARCQAGLPGLAVQWGPIGDAGYLTREGAVADLLSKRLGERLMTAAEALAGLPALIGSGLPVAGLARMRWGQMGVGLPLLQTPMFDAVRGDPAESGEATDLATMLASCTPEEAQTRLTDMLADEVARIMRMPSAGIPRHRPLAELGMDSLMAVELRLAVEQRFGLTLPVLALSDGITLTALAGRMARTSSGSAPAREDELHALAERISRFEQVEIPEGQLVAEPAVQS